MNCPNGCGELTQVSDTKQECPKCGYSFASPVKKGNKYIQEVNREIKNLLVVARLGNEPVPWQREWIMIPKRNYDSNRQYSGINRWLLSFDSDVCYITRESVEKRGLTVPDDAKSRLVVAWIPPRLSKQERADLNPDQQKERLRQKFPMMVTSRVFRSKDIPGLKEKTFETDKDNKRFDSIESFVKSIKGLVMEEGGNQPHYRHGEDKIIVPRIEQYSCSEEYYRDLFHELVHWTSHADRLSREHKKFGYGEEYSREELIAEMGAAYLCHYFGIPINENSVAYIDGWMRKIDADANLLVSAGQQAEKVLKYFNLTED